MPYPFARARIVAVAAATLFTVLATGVVLAHEERDVAGYTFEVGFIDEPVFVGQKSGFEFLVHKDDTPVEGLESSLNAVVIYPPSSEAPSSKKTADTVVSVVP